ncbi:helix-turn-helix domain-containing protein [Agathobaculum desmolans]|uniref:helix-turn-helix domain-containing protein n=1 Tax=Agathobaculum desmolans TaxID=39484 RepID=UPI0004E0E0E1|nr:helix-turn-helix domain-containing protein [Agathobaculum desmolans]
MEKWKELGLEEKVSLVEEYLAGRLRMREAARRAGVGHSTMENWISRYRSVGVSGLQENGNLAKRRYSGEVKRKAVEEYLSDHCSSMAIAEKYQLSSGNLVLDWVKAYHERDSTKGTGDSVMRRNHTNGRTAESGTVLPGRRRAA